MLLYSLDEGCPEINGLFLKILFFIFITLLNFTIYHRIDGSIKCQKGVGKHRGKVLHTTSFALFLSLFQYLGFQTGVYPIM